jgi:hypothetical protein
MVVTEQPPAARQGLLIERQGLLILAPAPQVQGCLVLQPQPLLPSHLQALAVTGGDQRVWEEALTFRPGSDDVASIRKACTKQANGGSRPLPLGIGLHVRANDGLQQPMDEQPVGDDE